MNQPLVLGHAGEEVIYVLVPVVIILWLKNIAARRNERDAQENADEGDPRSPPRKPD